MIKLVKEHLEGAPAFHAHNGLQKLPEMLIIEILVLPYDKKVFHRDLGFEHEFESF